MLIYQDITHCLFNSPLKFFFSNVLKRNLISTQLSKLITHKNLKQGYTQTHTHTIQYDYLLTCDQGLSSDEEFFIVAESSRKC